MLVSITWKKLITEEAMNELALFAGAGGGILGGNLLGWRTVCAVEWEAYPASVLCARQNDGLLPSFPIWDDVQTFDGKPWRGIVDVVSGGFPCQDISAAGKGGGIEAERSGMWKEMARIIGEVRPKYAFVENSPMLTSRGLGTVLRDLAKMGFDAEWGVLSAADVGANHKRERIWICAKQRNFFSYSLHNRDRWGQQQSESFKKTQSRMADTIELRTQRKSTNKRKPTKWIDSPSWWKIEPNVGRVANGVVAGMDRLKAIGNGQVPLCAATAFKLLKERLENGRN
jgi:DNA (cytosine-5)-methyltransferase 1